MNLSYNDRGGSLVGVMISAAIGLVVMLGLSKGLMNFANQTESIKRAADISIIKQNLTSKLRDLDIWQETMRTSNDGKEKVNLWKNIPGQNRPITLLDKGRVIMCRRKGGSNSQGVMVVNKDGTPQPLNCNTCDSSENCGYKKSDFSRVWLNVTPNDTNIPGYTGALEDTAGTKKSEKIDTTAISEELYDEAQVTCDVGQFLVKVENGKPICRDYDEGLKDKGSCGGNAVLVGFDKNGDKRCRDIREFANLLRPSIIGGRNCNRNRISFKGFDGNGNPICRDMTTEVRDVMNRYTNYINRTIRDTINNTYNRSVSYTNNQISRLGSGGFKRVRGSNDSDCASLSRMKCPNGYFMHGYEALMPTKGGHCSLSCRSFR